MFTIDMLVASVCTGFPVASLTSTDPTIVPQLLGPAIYFLVFVGFNSYSLTLLDGHLLLAPFIYTYVVNDLYVAFLVDAIQTIASVHLAILDRLAKIYEFYISCQNRNDILFVRYVPK